MKIKKLNIKRASLVTLVVLATQFTGCSRKSETNQTQATIESKTNQTPTPSVSTVSAIIPEKPRDLRKEDGIQFAIHGALFVTSPSGGRTSGTLANFGLLDSSGSFIPLEVSDHNFYDGVIKTEMFGDIILSSGTGEAFAATETQIKKIHEFLSAQNKKSTQPTTDSHNSIWKDSTTGLMWTKADNGSDFTQQQAADYCRNLSLAGFRDWRLPTIDELSQIYDGSGGGTSVHGSTSSGGITVYDGNAVASFFAKGGITLTGPFLWSSSPGQNSNEAWVFFFIGGTHMSDVTSTSGSHRALAVRRAKD